jgi:hypothetical protein
MYSRLGRFDEYRVTRAWLQRSQLRPSMTLGLNKRGFLQREAKPMFVAFGALQNGIALLNQLAIRLRIAHRIRPSSTLKPLPQATPKTAPEVSKTAWILSLK